MHRHVESRSRLPTLLGVSIVHALLIAWLIQQTTDVAPDQKSGTITVTSVSAEPAAVVPPPPAPPTKVADKAQAMILRADPTVPQATVAGQAGVPCAPHDVLLNAILLDPMALEAIRGAPAHLRSIADAIVIWNEGWNLQVVDPATALYQVRGIIEESLGAIPPDCLDQEVTGPRLLLVPDADGTRTTVIVFGSGVWSWRALLATPAEDSPVFVPLVNESGAGTPPLVPSAPRREQIRLPGIKLKLNDRGLRTSW